MATIAVLPQPADALDLLFGQDARFHWVARFSLRGRTYTLGAPGGTTMNSDRAIVPVWNAAGHITKVTVRATDRLQVLSRRLSGGGEYPEEVSA